MQIRSTYRFFLAVVAGLLLATLAVACSQSSTTFQPVTFGARPWSPPSGWDPEPPCGVGYYVAITTCAGCTNVSYALCDGDKFSQCTCGGRFWPGAICPQGFVCGPDDFPPWGWQEFTDYAGPGWAGLNDAGAAAPAAGDGG
jgi:hypothetical protein